MKFNIPNLSLKNPRKIIHYLSLPLILFSLVVCFMDINYWPIFILTLSSFLAWIGLWGVINLPQQKLAKMLNILIISVIVSLVFSTVTPALIFSGQIAVSPPLEITVLFLFICISLITIATAIAFLILRYLKYVANPQDTLGWFMKRAHGILVFAGALLFIGAAFSLGFCLREPEDVLSNLQIVLPGIISFIGFGFLVVSAILSYPISILVLGIRTTGKTVLRKKLETMYESVSSNAMCITKDKTGDLGFTPCVPDLTPRVTEQEITAFPEAYIMRLGNERVLLYDLPGDVNVRVTWSRVITEHKPRGIIFVMDHERGASPERTTEHREALRQLVEFLDKAGQTCKVILLLVTKYDDSCIGPKCERKGWAYSSVDISKIISTVDDELKAIEQKGIQILIHKSSGISGIEDERLNHALNNFFDVLSKTSSSSVTTKGSRVLCPDCFIDKSTAIPNITVNLGVFNAKSQKNIFPDKGICMNCGKFNSTVQDATPLEVVKKADYLLGVRLFNNLKGINIKEFGISMIVEKPASILGLTLPDGNGQTERRNHAGPILLDNIKYTVKPDGDIFLLFSLKAGDENGTAPIKVTSFVISSNELPNSIGFPEIILTPDKVEFITKAVAEPAKEEKVASRAAALPATTLATASVPNILMVNQTISLNITDSVIYRSNIPVLAGLPAIPGIVPGDIVNQNISIKTNIKDSIVSRSEISGNAGVAGPEKLPPDEKAPDDSGKNAPVQAVSSEIQITDSIIQRSQVAGTPTPAASIAEKTPAQDAPKQVTTSTAGRDSALEEKLTHQALDWLKTSVGLTKVNVDSSKWDGERFILAVKDPEKNQYTVIVGKDGKVESFKPS